MSPRKHAPQMVHVGGFGEEGTTELTESMLDGLQVLRPPISAETWM